MSFASGVLAIGTVERHDDDEDGLPVRSGPVVARVSKAVGLPSSTPDVAGLALRLPTTVGPTWDLLMTSAVGGGPWERRLPSPVHSWNDAVFSSLTPFEHSGIGWWVRARCATTITAEGLSLAGFEQTLRRGGVEIVLTQAAGNQDFRTLALLTLHDVHRTADAESHRLADLRFDHPTAANGGY